MTRSDLMTLWMAFQKLPGDVLSASLGDDFVTRHGVLQLNFQRFANNVGSNYPSVSTSELQSFYSFLINV